MGARLLQERPQDVGGRGSGGGGGGGAARGSQRAALVVYEREVHLGEFVRRALRRREARVVAVCMDARAHGQGGGRADEGVEAGGRADEGAEAGVRADEGGVKGGIEG